MYGTALIKVEGVAHDWDWLPGQWDGPGLTEADFLAVRQPKGLSKYVAAVDVDLQCNGVHKESLPPLDSIREEELAKKGAEDRKFAPPHYCPRHMPQPGPATAPAYDSVDISGTFGDGNPLPRF